ncbi:hypothetical protein Ciccas_009074, partial [Cichlidogyrus casuarinus]
AFDQSSQPILSNGHPSTRRLLVPICTGSMSVTSVELAQYLGEHQSQAFYGSLSIQADLADESRTSYKCKLGAPTAIDLAAETSENDSLPPCLCIPIHIFRRLTLAVNSIASRINDERKEIPEQGKKSELSSVSCFKQESDEFCSTNDKKSPLITIQVYFPVSCMASANETKITPDLKKRIHISPVSLIK